MGCEGSWMCARSEGVGSWTAGAEKKGRRSGGFRFFITPDVTQNGGRFNTSATL